ncbi:MAG: PqqD family peptide modification chaperone [Acidobacteriota bacterium]
MDIDDSTCYVRDPEPISADLDQEVVMLSVDMGKYFHCNESAARIWKMLEHPVTPPCIDDQLQRLFDVPTDECRAESRAFLQLLLEKRLICKVENAPA